MNCLERKGGALSLTDRSIPVETFRAFSSRFTLLKTA